MRYIPSGGNPTARIVAVGEAPGADEEKEGRNFIGASGRELDKMLIDGGLNRANVYTMNVSRFRPPGNDITRFIQRTPKAKVKYESLQSQGFVPFEGLMVQPHIITHVEMMWKELAALRPSVVIALGNTPLYFLTGKTGITSWRGSVMKASRDPKLTIIPTYHPAAILRQWPWRYDVVQDLRRVKRELLSPAPQPDWRFILRPSFEVVMDTLSQLENKAPLVLTCDIETRAKQIACLGLGWSDRDAICIPFMDVMKADHSYWSAEEEWAIVQRLIGVLTNPNIVLSNQNFLYDAFFMAVWWGHHIIPSFDTMIAQNVCFPGKEKSLGYLASIHCNQYCYWKEDGRDWNPHLPEEQLWGYNCEDCARTWEVTSSLTNVIRHRGLEDQFKFQMSLFEPVLETMVRGIRTSPSARADASQAMAKALTARRNTFNYLFGEEINLGSPAQLKTLFYDNLKQRPIIDRKTGQPTVGDQALEELKLRDPILKTPINLIQEYRTISVLKSHFIDIEGPEDRIYGAYNPAGTITYRFSSSANPFGWGTNLQNIPRVGGTAGAFGNLFPEVRSLFLPDDGYVWCDFDLDRADLQVVTWEADDEILKQMLREGIDIHSENAKVIGMSRQQAKSFVHGTNYGGSANTMAHNCGITRHQSEQGQARWFAAHPGIKRWHLRVERDLKTRREVSNKFGYKIFFFDRVDALLPEALAWIPQSTVAIIINKVLRRVYDAFSEDEVRFALQVHDSLLLQVRSTLRNILIPKILAIFGTIIVPYEDPLCIPAGCKMSPISWADVKEWDGSFD